MFLESPKRHHCAMQPLGSSFLSSAKKGTHAGPQGLVRSGREGSKRPNEVAKERERERERENHYWWEHVANSTSQVQVKAGDLWDPIYKINSRRLCMALPSSQTKSAKTAEYTVQMFKCWSAKSAGSCVLYTHRELMSALWEGQIH